ncbi:MAG: GerMN domain-containing protein, partial [Thermodesulfovibrionales bacterium]|nr:GerMN domain-containing protein [Thermodesulfovibrionales bacterium]
LYLDFNPELRYKSLFDANEEYLFLKALYNTIFINFKSVTNVRILVDGKEIETLAGHINISKGLKEVFD